MGESGVLFPRVYRNRCGDHKSGGGSLQQHRHFWTGIETSLAIACPKSLVLALPPISGVRTPDFANTVSMALSTMSAASSSCKWRSIMAPDQICATGFAIPRPAMSGAEPCTGSNIDGYFRSGLRLADGANPMDPTTAAPRSDKMSPSRLEATTTSNQSG